jgi:hypothetical protein
MGLEVGDGVLEADAATGVRVGVCVEVFVGVLVGVGVCVGVCVEVGVGVGVELLEGAAAAGVGEEVELCV